MSEYNKEWWKQCVPLFPLLLKKPTEDGMYLEWISTERTLNSTSDFIIQLYPEILSYTWINTILLPQLTCGTGFYSIQTAPCRQEILLPNWTPKARKNPVSPYA